MNAAERFARAGELFAGALGEPPATRAAWLARAAPDDELRRAAEELLAAHARADEHFLAPPGEPLGPGARLGDFTLLAELGQGGMGTVFVARQEHPPRRVALKVVRAAAGDARREARLALEAELMARLAHPDIARIYAAGSERDALGARTWIAMELVEDAQDLVRHCRTAGLDLAARLALFARLCAAVEHGHRHGVVHCDLKAENVLVDAHGALKVIDFGIARLAGQESARPGSVAGSLAALSPEQAAGEPPDAQSDVYALGALLHELLTGARVHDLAGLDLAAALTKLRAAPPPEPRRHAPGLARELEAILARALAPARARRYASVFALAEDLRRFRAHEPLEALPAGPLRRARLCARRHRFGLLAGALVASALLAGTLVSVRFGLAAVRAAEDERAARLHAEHLATLQRTLFESPRPRQALGRAPTVRELLDDARFHAERTLAAEPEVLGELQATLAQTYLDVGEGATARELFERALAALAPTAPPARLGALHSALGEACLECADYPAATAALQHAREELARAGPAAEAALVLTDVRAAELARLSGGSAEGRARLAALLPRLAGPEDGLLRVRVLDQLGELARGSGALAEAAALHEEALALERELLPPLHPARAATENALANARFELGQTAAAEEHWRAALTVFEAVLDPSHPDLVTVLGNLALVHQERREFAAARGLFQRALALRREAFGPDHPRTLASVQRLANLELAAGDAEAARRVAEEALLGERALAARGAGEPVGLEQALFTLALAERALGQTGAARGHLAESLALQAARLPPGHLELAQGRTLLGSLLLAEEAFAAAEAELTAAVRVRRAELPGHWLTANTESLLGAALLAQGRVEEAAPLLLGAVPVLERALGADDYRTREARQRALELP